MIAVDAMGGDFAPQAIVHGAYCAASAFLPVKLFGPEKELGSLLLALDASWQRYPIHICDSPGYISMAENPVDAVKKKRDSSLVKAVESVAQGACSAVISAGNSGALMVAATLLIGRVDHIDRPAIVGMLSPSLSDKENWDPIIVLDLGANTDCRPEHLYQFAHMGVSFAQHELKRKNPCVGLLSNGHEDTKGSLLTKQAFKLLERSKINFIGNIEPYDVFSCTYTNIQANKPVSGRKLDVLVCDGFTGNIFLKTIESIQNAYRAHMQSFQPENILRKSFLQSSGGALLLGIRKHVIVCHGNSGYRSIGQAIRFVSGLNFANFGTKKGVGFVRK